MPKIIVVRGLSNTGKTTAIRASMNILGVHVRARPQDVLLSAYLHIGGNGYSVGFASGGDTPKIVQDNVNFFRQFQLSCMVFACRSRGGGFNILSAYAANLGTTPHILHSPSKSLTQDILNLIP